MLTALASQHPVVPVIQRHRKLAKLLTTYLDGKLVPHPDPRERGGQVTESARAHSYYSS